MEPEHHKAKCQCNECIRAHDSAIRDFKNRNALAALPKEFPQLTLPQARFGYERGEWRALKRNGGTLRGLQHLGKLTILATDGLLAWLALPDTRQSVDLLRITDALERVRASAGYTTQVILAHVANFDGKVEPLYSAKAQTASRPKAVTKQSAKAALLATL